MQHPVGVLVPQGGAGVHHLGLDPQPEQQAHLVQLCPKALDAVGQRLVVDLPVAQAAVIVIAVGEPAVVQNEQLDAQALGLGGKAQQFFFGKVEIGGLPVVHQDGADFVPPLAPGQPGAVELVVGLGHPVQALLGVDQHRLGGGEALARMQVPAEALGMDAHGHTGDVVGVHVGLGGKVAAVHQAEAVHFPREFGGLMPLEGKEGVEVVAGAPPQGVHPLHAVGQRPGDDVALPGPGAGQLHQVVVHVGQVEAETHGPVQTQRAFAGVADDGVAGQDGQPLVQGIDQVHRDAGQRIGQGDGQGDGLVRGFHIGGGQFAAFQGRLARRDGVGLVVQVQQAAAVGRGGVQRGQMDVARAAGGVLLLDVLEGIGGLPVEIVHRHGAVSRLEQVVEIGAVVDGPAVVQLAQMAAGQDFEDVADPSVVQMEGLAFLVKFDCHGCRSFLLSTMTDTWKKRAGPAGLALWVPSKMIIHHSPGSLQ